MCKRCWRNFNRSATTNASLTEFRLQTIHQEHIAKQAENVVLLMSLLIRLMIPGDSEEMHAQVLKLVKDFNKEALEWRDRVEWIGRRADG